ncbi:anthranilate phosphoribosyltransferase [Malaciobacter molluscorum LMG 25693]|uniref:Anthranilate phosphoribosyltransferase n=1 Tax=Malaciobacter molluscorum LMG 25693 TaxID=870501 RepID=A0A2G1DIL4_9BACT|nr:anthranilate phosphoribosyltransferase [Malaciobacter molluscorum]AXX92363.1 anthranilate phosphoribosyltransferase / anthranilate synthase component II, TrpD subunit [Malaciobacter molluscorum LMG 25693]PHO18186.1 anthranilate phosphoribosyltransferase [Malaciobacter molluscorum LMG 25693]RXJ93975.1 anthranilate phosphoribosyltransferase [Malaciobacter molluscorum]
MFNLAKLKFDDIFENRLSQDEVRDYLIELYKRGETAAEIAAAASAMREHMIPLAIDYELKSKTIDVVGTGGDKSYSFNISSTVSILLASCGSYVAKHGNRSITSKSGSADMLEFLGINLNLTSPKLVTMLEETGFCFMFAANHHPAMKYIMPIRKSIDHRTIFNILGPLSNPASVSKQMVGVFSKDYVGKLTDALNMLDTKRAMVVSSNDGMDEISISDITFANSLINGKIEEFEIDPQLLGFKLSSKDSIVGGDAKINAKITKDILENKITDSKLDIVLLNAAASLVVDDKARDMKEGIEIARNAILSGKSKKKLEEIIKISNQLIK